jgi:hypothetical protein
MLMLTVKHEEEMTIIKDLSQYGIAAHRGQSGVTTIREGAA